MNTLPEAVKAALRRANAEILGLRAIVEGRGEADDAIDRALERLEGTIARAAEGNPNHKGKGPGGGQFASGPGGGGDGSDRPHGKHWAKRQRRKKRKTKATRKPGQAAKKARAKPATKAAGTKRRDTHSPNAKEKADRLKKGKPAEYASEKARRAAEHQNKTDGRIQEYTKANEERFAKRMGGESFPDNGPTDVELKLGGKTHGIELKTITHGKNDKVTMKASAIARKVEWEKASKTQMHTVVLDHRDKKVGGQDSTKLYSHNEIYYKRGVGSFRIEQMLKVKDEIELKALMTTPYDKLPKEAQGPIRGTKH